MTEEFISTIELKHLLIDTFRIFERLDRTLVIGLEATGEQYLTEHTFLQNERTHIYKTTLIIRKIAAKTLSSSEISDYRNAGVERVEKIDSLLNNLYEKKKVLPSLENISVLPPEEKRLNQFKLGILERLTEELVQEKNDIKHLFDIKHQPGLNLMSFLDPSNEIILEKKPEDASTPSQDIRKNIFICYSHKDSKWLERLYEYLMPLPTIIPNLKVWNDSEIKSGDDWELEIKEALEKTKVAILLLSQNFVNAPYIVNKELPYLFMESKKEHVQLYLIILEPCILGHLGLDKLQAENSVSNSIDKLDESERKHFFYTFTNKIIGFYKNL